MYSGGILFFGGWSLYAGPVALILTAALVVLWVGKTAVEERHLRDVYPAYAEYETRVQSAPRARPLLMQWPESVERVAAFLRETGAEARLEELGTETPTAAARPPTRSAARSARSSSRSCSSCDGAPVVALVPGDRRADTGKVARARRSADACRREPAEDVVEATGFRPVRWRRSPSSACRSCSSSGRSSDTRRSGPARARTGTWSPCRPPSSCASRAVGSRTSCWNHHNPRKTTANGGKRCRRPRRSG